MAGGWNITVAKRDFVEAIGVARSRATLRRKSGIQFESDLTLVACPGGLSVRSSFSAMDIDGEGEGASPIMVYAPAIRQVAPKLAGPTITLRYEPGKLFLQRHVVYSQGRVKFNVGIRRHSPLTGTIGGHIGGHAQNCLTSNG